jgi:ribosomal protein S6
MKYYELAYLISPLLTEEEARTFHSGISSFIQKEEGLLGTENILIRRLLAYPINKQTQAYFAALSFQISQEKIANLDKKLKSEKQILRYLIIITKKPRLISKPEGVIPISRKEDKIAPKKEKKVELQEIEKKLEEILDEPK